MWSTWRPNRRASIFRNIAARFGRTIVYIPIGQLSPVTMKKIRVVHVLDGYDKRDIAKEYHLVAKAPHNRPPFSIGVDRRPDDFAAS